MQLKIAAIFIQTLVYNHLEIYLIVERVPDHCQLIIKPILKNVKRILSKILLRKKHARSKIVQFVTGCAFDLRGKFMVQN